MDREKLKNERKILQKEPKGSSGKEEKEKNKCVVWNVYRI